MDGSELVEAVRAAEATELDRLGSGKALVAELDDEPATPEPDALHGYLRGLEATGERVGAGMVDRALASARSLLQFVNYFVNEGDDRADLFRGFREDTTDHVDRGARLLDGVCGSETEGTAARTAAERAIDRSYGKYESALERMGVDPKPVC